MGEKCEFMNVVDMHCDTISGLWRQRREGKHPSLRSNQMHMDLERMQKGDYLLQNFAMFVMLEREPDPLVNVLELIDEYYRQIEENRDLIAPVHTYADIQRNVEAGRMSAMLTIEEGGVLKGSVEVLRNLYRLGVRMLTLTWNFENELGWPNTVARLPGYDPAKRYGLKPAGIEVVREMNRLGMIIDVSHLGDDGFWDVVTNSDRPFVASHSNARAVCGHSRNLTDEMIRALADKGGVMGINFCGDFLNPDGSSRTADMVRHIKHIRNVGGIGCIGLGTDFDGIDGELEIRDAAHMPLLIGELERAGFTGAEIDAVTHGNVLRLYQEILR